MSAQLINKLSKELLSIKQRLAVLETGNIQPIVETTYSNISNTLQFSNLNEIFFTFTTNKVSNISLTKILFGGIKSSNPQNIIFEIRDNNNNTLYRPINIIVNDTNINVSFNSVFLLLNTKYIIYIKLNTDDIINFSNGLVREIVSNMQAQQADLVLLNQSDVRGEGRVAEQPQVVYQKTILQSTEITQTRLDEFTRLEDINIIDQLQPVGPTKVTTVGLDPTKVVSDMTSGRTKYIQDIMYNTSEQLYQSYDKGLITQMELSMIKLGQQGLGQLDQGELGKKQLIELETKVNEFGKSLLIQLEPEKQLLYQERLEQNLLENQLTQEMLSDSSFYIKYNKYQEQNVYYLPINIICVLHYNINKIESASIKLDLIPTMSLINKPTKLSIDQTLIDKKLAQITANEQKLAIITDKQLAITADEKLAIELDEKNQTTLASDKLIKLSEEKQKLFDMEQELIFVIDKANIDILVIKNQEQLLINKERQSQSIMTNVLNMLLATDKQVIDEQASDKLAKNALTVALTEQQDAINALAETQAKAAIEIQAVSTELTNANKQLENILANIDNLVAEEAIVQKQKADANIAAATNTDTDALAYILATIKKADADIDTILTAKTALEAEKQKAIDVLTLAKQKKEDTNAIILIAIKSAEKRVTDATLAVEALNKAQVLDNTLPEKIKVADTTLSTDESIFKSNKLQFNF